MSAFVLQQWRFGSKPVDEHGSYVHIVARAAGPLSWLLRPLRLQSTVKVLVGLDRVEINQTSLAGSRVRFIPLESLSSTYHGVQRPWGSALGVLVVFIALAGGLNLLDPHTDAVVSLALAGCGLVLGLLQLALQRTLTLGFVESGGVVSSVSFKRSVIEGVTINDEQTRQVCKVVHRLIEAKAKRRLLNMAA